MFFVCVCVCLPLQPFAQWCCLQPKDTAKMPESAWKLVFYTMSWSYSTYLLFFTQYTFFYNPPSVFYGKPQVQPSLRWRPHVFKFKGLSVIGKVSYYRLNCWCQVMAKGCFYLWFYKWPLTNPASVTAHCIRSQSCGWCSNVLSVGLLRLLLKTPVQSVPRAHIK